VPNRDPESVPSRRLPLRGADLILLGLDAESGGSHAGCHNGVMALECEGPLSADRLTAALARFLRYCPWPAARLARPFPWGALSWTVPRGRLEAPPVKRLTVPALDEQTVLRLAEDELNDRIDPWRQPVVRFLVVDESSGGRSALVVAFSRPLMDPRGADTFLLQLDELDRSPDASPWKTRPLFESPEDARPLRVRGPIARRSQGFLRAIAAVPPLSLGHGIRGTGRVRIMRAVLSDSATPRGHRETLFRLAAVGKAVNRLWQRRRLPDVPFLVPVSVDMRPKGQRGPTFGNYLTFHFARFLPSETGDSRALASRLRLLMADALREGSIDAHWVGMEFTRYRPVRSILKEMPWARKGGDPFSFNCADTGEFAPGLESFLGARLRRLVHAPGVLPRPGIGVFFTRCQGLESVTACWVEGVLSEAESREILDGVVAEIGEERVP
jgi:hypothetical protein